MKFGSREICDVVFRAKSTQKIGNATFYAGQPVLLIDTAKTSTIEGDSETTYATGGRGNPNLIAWDGSKSITFTVEDALFSPIGLSILMGADIAETNNKQEVHVHKMVKVTAKDVNGTVTLDLSNLLAAELTGTDPWYKITQRICADAPLYVIPVEEDGSIKGTFSQNVSVTTTVTVNSAHTDFTAKTQTITGANLVAGTTYLVDCYVIRNAEGITEIQVRKDKFAGYFYVEAETLYRRQDTGADLPAVITIPKVKIQSNFSFSMSADGDPSTATFTMDAFPDKVCCQAA